jgi:hypothetical protein
MPELTRSRDPHRSQCWLIYFGDVHVGSVGRAVGIPGAAERWVWFCGFYPGSNPGEQAHGTAVTFDQARADFDKAWQVFSARRTEADYEEWREQRDWTAQKVAALRWREQSIQI